ncbi:hypothetical protein ACQKWADRAFT_282664 [Trichoderma austrokoningii]
MCVHCDTGLAKPARGDQSSVDIGHLMLTALLLSTWSTLAICNSFFSDSRSSSCRVVPCIALSLFLITYYQCLFANGFVYCG